MCSRPIAFVVALLALVAVPVAAQQVPHPRSALVVGTVTDSATGAAVAGATVTFRPAGRTVFTDEHGAFSIRLWEGPEALTIEQLGYHTAQLPVAVDGGMAPRAVRLAPDPVMLKGIAVINRRSASNPLAIAMAVRTFNENDLAHADDSSVRQFLDSRGAFTATRCPWGAWSIVCISSRGQVIEPRVWIDDYRLYGGLEELSMFPLHDVYRVDVYQRGLYIHVLTKSYMEETVHRGWPVFSPF